MTLETELTAPEKPSHPRPLVVDDSPFANLLDSKKFEQMWRVAMVFSKTKTIPSHYQNSPEECFVALEMAFRLQVNPMMFMQKTYVVNGKPGMEAQLAIALVNARGPFKGPIQYELTGEGDTRACRAYAVHKATGETCEAHVSVKMAKAEGWYGRNPKWKNMTDLMLSYRSASFLARLYCPETILGMLTADEVEDIRSVESDMIDPTGSKPPAGYWEALRNGDDAQAQLLIGGEGFDVRVIDGARQIVKVTKSAAPDPIQELEEAPPPPTRVQNQTVNGADAIVNRFHEAYNVSQDQLEFIVGLNRDEWGPSDLAKLRDIGVSIKNGDAKIEDFLPPVETTTDAPVESLIPDDKPKSKSKKSHTADAFSA